MSDGTLAVTAGSGTLVRVVNRTITAQTVKSQYVTLDEPDAPTYTVATGDIVLTTALAHVLTVNAGASNNVWIHRVRVYQSVVVTTAAILNLELWTTSTAAPTGGTAQTVTAIAGDSAAGATAMSLPTAKATEVARVAQASYSLMQTAPTAGANLLIADWDFGKHLRAKGLRITKGTTNGIAIKQVAAHAGASVRITVVLSEWADF